MKGPGRVLTGWQARIVTIAAIVGGLYSPAQGQGTDVALLVEQSPPDGGILTPSPGVHFFALNSEVVLIAIPNPGYQFIYWLGDVGDHTANRTITYLSKPKIIIAIFGQVEHQPSSMGQAVVGGGGRVTSGGSSTATADYGWPGQQQPPIPPQPPTSEPPIPEPATGILLLLCSLFAIAQRGTNKHATRGGAAG